MKTEIEYPKEVRRLLFCLNCLHEDTLPVLSDKITSALETIGMDSISRSPDGDTLPAEDLAVALGLIAELKSTVKLGEELYQNSTEEPQPTHEIPSVEHPKQQETYSNGARHAAPSVTPIEVSPGERHLLTAMGIGKAASTPFDILSDATSIFSSELTVLGAALEHSNLDQAVVVDGMRGRLKGIDQLCTQLHNRIYAAEEATS